MRVPTSFPRLAVALAAAMLSVATWAGAPVPVADDAPDAAADASARSMALYGQDYSQSDPAALDTTALTDDHSINVPTAQWLYTNVSASQVGSYLSTNGARLTDLEVYAVSSGVPTFTVRMVKNSGAYAVPGWWWYYGLTFADVGARLSANSARLIELEPYDSGGGVIRFAAVMVSNTGSAARSWSYLGGVSSSQISSQISSSGHRLIDLDSYVEGGVKKYDAVFVANTGTDAKTWEWWINQTASGIASKVSAFSGRIVKLDRQADGTYNFIQVKNTGTDNSAWWYSYGFATAADVLNYANQLASRPVDVVTYLNSSGFRRYDAVFIDNAAASTRRMRSVYGANFLDSSGAPTRGIFEAYLKQVGGTVKVDLNSARKAEVASSLKSLHLLHAMKQVEAGSDTLTSAFVYYDYLSGTLTDRKNACPDPAKETAVNQRNDFNFSQGLRSMMNISDNRATRGVVLRYGGFAPINSTGVSAGLVSTQIRHNIGCAYYNLTTLKYDPTNRRNDTTAADLAHIYEGVWASTAISETHSARTEYLNAANPSSGAGTAIQAIINQEASALGKSAIASQFGSLIRNWGKGGSYDTCLPDAAGACGQKVIVRSGTGLIRLPIKSSGVVAYRTYSFGNMISDVPVGCWEDFTTSTVECPIDTNYSNAFGSATAELFRDEIRSALLTW